MEESGTNEIVLVVDTCIYLVKNVSSLESAKTHYTIPLKRNSRLIDYTPSQARHFTFQDHPIFYSRYLSHGRTIFTFRNDFLKAEEEKDYLGRNKSGYSRVSGRMGTVSGENIYGILKSRADIKQS